MDDGRNVVTGCPTPVAAGCLAALTPAGFAPVRQSPAALPPDLSFEDLLI